jgi:hypothetical protein
MSDLWATSMGTWCDEFADLMLPFDRLALARADLVFMGNATPGFSYVVPDPCPDGFSQVLRSDLTLAMSHYPTGAHLRLDLCSFKTGHGSSPRCVGGNGAMWVMRQPNPRVSGLIRRSLDDRQALSLFIFPWLPIPQWAEFRFFVRKGAVVGISQYHAESTFGQIAQYDTALRAGFDTFATTALPRLKLPDVVIDVIAEPIPNGFRMRLIELNPLVQRTDPCLFSWDNGGDFDGSFRYRRDSAGQSEKTLAPAMAATLVPRKEAEDDVWRI